MTCRLATLAQPIPNAIHTLEADFDVTPTLKVTLIPKSTPVATATTPPTSKMTPIPRLMLIITRTQGVTSINLYLKDENEIHDTKRDVLYLMSSKAT